MKIYNTLTRKLENFKPINNKTVLFYQCGPTVYWIQHIGNLRAMVWADLIRRSLIYLGYKVKFVRNYTDVGHLTSDEDRGEDKMEKGAKREGLTPQELAKKYIKIFENDTRALNILEPTYKPKATEYIKQMQEMIKILLDKGYAYLTDLAVVYDVSKFKNYNQLNRQKLDLNLQGAGKGEINDPQKKHFADFNLWVFKKGPHKNALQTWPSPWGEGFPGWHIECSVMAKTLLGETIDLHMGGVEHISVHHTNEIAQSEAANGKKFVNYWIHNEHLLVNNQKMSKSEGNIITLTDIIKKGFHPLDLRYFYLQAHYRSKQNFTFEALSAAHEALKNLKNQIVFKKLNLSLLKSKKLFSYRKKFIDYISNDFQIPQALALVWQIIKSKNLSAEEKSALILDFDKVFGLKLNQKTVEKIPQQVIDLAEERKIAREKKDFQKADELRQKIETLGYKIEDLPKNNYKIIKK